MNVFDYLHWRSDLTFEEKAVNELDALVFSLLSYEFFDALFETQNSYTLKECAKQFFSIYKEEYLIKRKTFSYRSYLILKEMANSKRYQDLVISNYVNEIDGNLNLQFAALTLTYKTEWKYLVFRGTDDNFAGWKEDFSMFYVPIIEGQNKALEYINQEKSSVHKLYIGGHSKGGNLAVYASLLADKEIQNRIVSIESLDGPGLHREIISLVENTALASKIHIYLPEESFFGRWLFHPVSIQLIKSEGKGMQQHSLYNWQVDVDHFVCGDHFSENSNRAIQALQDIVSSQTKLELKKITEELFAILDNLEIYTLKDASEIHFADFIKAIKELNNLDATTKRFVNELFSLMWDYTMK